MKIYILNSFSDESIADLGSYNFTRQPILMPMVCRKSLLWIGEGDKET